MFVRRLDVARETEPGEHAAQTHEVLIILKRDIVSEQVSGAGVYQDEVGNELENRPVVENEHFVGKCEVFPLGLLC